MGKIRNRKKWIAKPTRLSEGLRLARTRHKGFTQKSVAEVTGIPRPRISEYETGARIPSQKTLNKLLRYYLDRQLISFAKYVEIKTDWNGACQEQHVENFPYMKG